MWCRRLVSYRCIPMLLMLLHVRVRCCVRVLGVRGHRRRVRGCRTRRHVLLLLRCVVILGLVLQRCVMEARKLFRIGGRCDQQQQRRRQHIGRRAPHHPHARRAVPFCASLCNARRDPFSAMLVARARRCCCYSCFFCAFPTPHTVPQSVIHVCLAVAPVPDCRGLVLGSYPPLYINQSTAAYVLYAPSPGPDASGLAEVRAVL